METRSGNRNALAVLLAVNAMGILLLYWLRTDQLLKIVLDLGAPDAPAMRAALHAYVLYGAAMISLLLFLIFLLVERFLHGSIAAALAVVVVITSISVFLYVDTTVFRDYGIHAYDFDIGRVFVDAAAARDLGVRKSDLLLALVAAASIIAVEASVFFGIRRVLRHGAIWKFIIAGLAVIVAGTGLQFHATSHRVSTDPVEFQELLPFHELVLLQRKARPFIDVVARVGRGGYPTVQSNGAPRIENKRNIVFFVSDAMRADLASPANGLTPYMTQFSARPDVLASKRHYSTAHVTEMGVFGLLYSLNGYDFNAFVAERVPSYPLSVLHANGYTTAMIAGSPIPPYPSDYLTHMWDTVMRPANDEQAISMLRDYVTARRRDGKPYFLFAFFYSPHWPFDNVLPQNQRFRPTLATVHRTPFSDMEDSAFRAATRNSMKNAILQADFNFKRVDDFLRPDSAGTALVVTSDHGTEMWERGVFGHGRSVFWNEKFLVPMMMQLPGARLEGRKNPSLSTHADIWPTLFDYLGIRTSARFADGVSLLSTPDTQLVKRRDIVLSGRYFPYAGRPNALVLPEGKVWFRVYSDSGKLKTKALRFTTIDDKEQAARAVPELPAFISRLEEFLTVKH